VAVGEVGSDDGGSCCRNLGAEMHQVGVIPLLIDAAVFKVRYHALSINISHMFQIPMHDSMNLVFSI